MKSQLLVNIASLFSIRVAGYIIPLITLPYLIKTLGVSSYGNLALGLAIVQYFQLIVNFGFDLSATERISKMREDIIIVSRIYWSVIFFRIIMTIIGFFVLFIISTYSELLHSIDRILYFSYLTVLGVAIFPQWLFQGKEELGIISICRVLFQVISVPLFFVFIENANDAWKAAAIYSLPHLAIGIFSIYIIIKKKWVKFTTITIDDVKDEVFRSIPLFISSAAVSIYTTTITVVLGFISSPTNVGLYAAASKIIQAFQGIYQPIAMAYYPRISKFVTESRVRAINEIIKLRNIQIVLNASISIFLYFYAELLIMLLFGSEYLEAVIVLKILSPIPFVVGLSNIYGIQTLLTFGFKKVFSRILILSAMANLLMIYPLCYAYYEIGAAISVLATELLVTVLMMFSVKKNKILNKET